MLRITIEPGETIRLEEQEMTIVYEKANIHPLYPCCGCALVDKPNLCTMMSCHRGYQYHEKMDN